MSKNPFSYIVLQSTVDTASGFNDIGLMTMFWRFAILKRNVAVLTQKILIYLRQILKGLYAEHFLLTLNSRWIYCSFCKVRVVVVKTVNKSLESKNMISFRR